MGDPPSRSRACGRRGGAGGVALPPMSFSGSSSRSPPASSETPRSGLTAPADENVSGANGSAKGSAPEPLAPDIGPKASTSHSAPARPATTDGSARHRHPDLVGLDEDGIARLQGMGPPANEAFALLVDEHPVGALVLDVEDAVGEPDGRMPGRYLVVREDPVTGRRPADDAPLGPELGPRRRSKRGGLGTTHFEGEGHRHNLCLCSLPQGCACLLSRASAGGPAVTARATQTA